MIHIVCSIFDLKANAFSPPAFFQAKGIAIRAFADAIAEARGPLGKHPEDYVLHQLGTWNDNTGTFTNVEDLTVLASGAQYVNFIPAPEKT